jgi:hypothetical protein
MESNIPGGKEDEHFDSHLLESGVRTLPTRLDSYTQIHSRFKPSRFVGMMSGAYSNPARPVLCPIAVRSRINYYSALSNPVWRVNLLQPRIR